MLWFIKPHVLTFPLDPDLGWQMFRKFISSRTRVCHAPGTQWTTLPSPEEPLGRCVNGWSRRRGGARGKQEADLLEDVSGIMGGQDTLVIAHSNGVFHHHIQWCA